MLLSWVTWVYSSKRYDDDSDTSDDIPVPRFRDLGEMRYRVTRKYELRETKPVCYTEAADDIDLE